jgi:putative tryptophan/tyrosine transport system substrate-binding protein
LPELSGKQIELLKEVVPRLSKPGVLWDSAIGEAQFRAAQTAAHAAGVTLHSLPIRGPEDFKDAFDRAAREQIDGVVILSSPLILERRSQIVEWAIKARHPRSASSLCFQAPGG